MCRNQKKEVELRSADETSFCGEINNRQIIDKDWFSEILIDNSKNVKMDSGAQCKFYRLRNIKCGK